MVFECELTAAYILIIDRACVASARGSLMDGHQDISVPNALMCMLINPSIVIIHLRIREIHSPQHIIEFVYRQRPRVTVAVVQSRLPV